MPTLDDSIALDGKPKDIMARRYYADKGAAPASKQKDEWLTGPGVWHTYTDAESLMDTREIDDDMLKKMKTERAAEVKEMRNAMDDLEDTGRQITDLEQEYVREFVEMLDRREWERRHLEKLRKQIDNLHQEYTAVFDEMVERIGSKRSEVKELRIKIKETSTIDMVDEMRREIMELDEELIAEFDEMVERMMQRSLLDGDVVMSLAFICKDR